MRTLDAVFDDIDQMCESVRAWNLDFQPLSNGGTARHVACIVQSEACGALFGHARFHAPLQQQGAPPPGFLTFVVQESGMRGLWWRGHDVDADKVLAFPRHGELSSVSGADFDIHTISVTEETLADVAAALELAAPRHGSLAEVFAVPRNILDPLRLRLRRLRNGVTVPQPGQAVVMLMALLPYWLKPARHGERGRPEPKAKTRAIRKSLELMEAKPLTELSAEHLRAYAGVSERTLQYAFRDRFDLTPAAFIKARRLAAVRAVLKGSLKEGSYGGPVAVGDIAAQFGFWHSGQFAVDYKRAFGELPSTTLQGTRSRTT